MKINFKFKAVIYSMLLLFIISCQTGSQNELKPENNQTFNDTILPKYAKGFYFIKLDGNLTSLVFLNSEGKKAVSFQLSADSLQQNAIKIPVKNTIAFSTTHYGFLQPLKQTQIIKGVSGKDYLVSDTKNNIEEIGFADNLNFEKIVSIKPQVILGNGLESLTSPYVEKFKQFNITYLPISEYAEDSPLARAEWIKVFGLITNKLAEADAIFKEIEQKYLHLKSKASNYSKSNKKPIVLMSFPYQKIWYVPGGKSFQAAFVNDAGGEYIFKDNTDKGSFTADAEIILAKGKTADFWLNVNQINTKQEIAKENAVFTQFKSFKNNTIFNNNKQVYGKANVYYQTGVVNPHLILQDIIRILHQDSIKNLYYYKQIK
jgi:iron complex transport system substrate-binding protein